MPIVHGSRGTTRAAFDVAGKGPEVNGIVISNRVGSPKRAPTTEKERFQRNSTAAQDRGDDLTKIKEDMKLSLQRKGLDMTKTRVRARAGGTARCSAVWRGAALRCAAQRGGVRVGGGRLWCGAGGASYTRATKSSTCPHLQREPRLETVPTRLPTFCSPNAHSMLTQCSLNAHRSPLTAHRSPPLQPSLTPCS